MFKYMDWMGPPSSDTIRFENPMIEELWKDNDRLKGFEAAFWKAGGKTVRFALLVRLLFDGRLGLNLCACFQAGANFG